MILISEVWLEPNRLSNLRITKILSQLATRKLRLKMTATGWKRSFSEPHSICCWESTRRP
jgi:hypothetical protein